MKKRVISVLLAFLMVAALLTACGAPAAAGTSAGTASTPASPASGGEAGGEPVTISFTYWGSTYEQEAMEAAIAGFMDINPDIKVDAQLIPGDYDTKLAAMVAGNEAPDIAYLMDFMALPYAAEGKLVNILDLIDADPELDSEDFVDGAFLYWEPDKAYGLFTALEIFGLFYNKQAFADAGVDPLPTTVQDALTWDELIEVAKQLTFDQNGNTPNDAEFDKSQIRQYGLRFDYIQQTYMIAVMANGGSYVSDDGMSFALTSPEAVQAIQTMADAVNVAKVSPSPAEAKSIPTGAVSLISQQTAIYMGGNWNLLDFAGADLDFGVGILPKGAAGFASGGAQGSMSIFSSSEHQEETYRFWKYLVNPESSLTLHQAGLWMPLVREWYEEPLVSEWAEGNAAHPEGYRDSFVALATDHFTKNPSAYVKNFAQINAIVQPAIERVFMGEGSAQDIMAEIEPQVNELTQGRYDR